MSVGRRSKSKAGGCVAGVHRSSGQLVGDITGWHLRCNCGRAVVYVSRAGDWADMVVYMKSVLNKRDKEKYA